MSILTILYISFWFTVGCVATLAALELARTLLLIGLTKLEDHIKEKNGIPTIDEETIQGDDLIAFGEQFMSKHHRITH